MNKGRRPEAGPTRRATGPTAASAGMDPIAIGLQHLFASVADEPVPDEFLKLLDRIEAGEQARKAGKHAVDGEDTTAADGIASGTASGGRVDGAASGGKMDGAAGGGRADGA